MRKRMGRLVFLLGLLVFAACGNPPSRQEKSARDRGADNPKARAQAELIAKAGVWQLTKFSQPDPGTIVLTITDPQSGRELPVTAQMPHSQWGSYLHFQGLEGANIKFRFRRSGFREDMKNENNGDYLYPEEASDGSVEGSSNGPSFFIGCKPLGKSI